MKFSFIASVGAALLLGAQSMAEQVRPEARPVLEPVVVQIVPTEVTDLTSENSPLVQIEPTVVTGPILGPETNLPLPRFVSLKSNEGNVRRGPSLSHRIDWVYLRRGMPLEVTAEYGHWRRVRDREGVGGWVHYALLSGTRTVLVEVDRLPIYRQPDPSSTQVAFFEMGVIGHLGDCTIDWCEVSSGGYNGWAEKDALWGVLPDEIRE